MKCVKCGKDKKYKDLISGGESVICIDCFNKSLEISKCKVCGREFSKWRFCLECGEINHAYTNKNYIGE